MRIEHHLLAFAHVGANKHHPAVTETNMGDLYGCRHSVDQNDLVAPVELVSFSPVHRTAVRRLPPSPHRVSSIKPNMNHTDTC